MGPEWVLPVHTAKRRGCKGGGRGEGRNDARLPGVVASGRCVWLSLRCSWVPKGSFAFVVMDRTAEGGGKSQRGPLEGQGFVESARKLE